MTRLHVPTEAPATLETFDTFPDRADRTAMLLNYSDQFREVPPEVATRPFAKSHQVPQCESDAYVWATTQPDRTLELYFAVNPIRVSARALAAILERTLSGRRLRTSRKWTRESWRRIFRQNMSVGKGIGLMAMVEACGRSQTERPAPQRLATTNRS